MICSLVTCLFRKILTWFVFCSSTLHNFTRDRLFVSLYLLFCIPISIMKYQSYNYWCRCAVLHINIHHSNARCLSLFNINGSLCKGNSFYPFLSCCLAQTSGPKLLHAQMSAHHRLSCQNLTALCQCLLSSVVVRAGAAEIAPVGCLVPSSLQKSWVTESTPCFTGVLWDHIRWRTCHLRRR